ncbi:MAG: hypothetical protein H5T69_10300 [Chloroflexi bacterium]|nr:hypothetical protein [Chloroflexota bacterium]
MKRYRWLMGILLIALSLMGDLSAYAAPPGLPAVFYGSVKVGEGNIPLGSVVHAYIDGVGFDQATVQQDPGQGTVYVLNVRADDPDTPEKEGGRDGDVVTFRLEMPGGETRHMVQRGVWYSGEAMLLNLTSYQPGRRKFHSTQ